MLKNHKIADDNNATHKFRYVNNVLLNPQDETELVNVLDYIETVMRGGRCRWRIENETFNTLKNQGYQLEHSYAHGKKHLATNFLSFDTDTINRDHVSS